MLWTTIDKIYQKLRERVGRKFPNMLMRMVGKHELWNENVKHHGLYSVVQRCRVVLGPSGLGGRNSGYRGQDDWHTLVRFGDHELRGLLVVNFHLKPMQSFSPTCTCQICSCGATNCLRPHKAKSSASLSSSMHDGNDNNNTANKFSHACLKYMRTDHSWLHSLSEPNWLGHSIKR